MDHRLLNYCLGLLDVMAFIRFPVVAQRLSVVSHIRRCVSSGAASGSTTPPQKPPVSPPKGPSTTSTSVSSTDPTKYNVPEYYKHDVFSYYDIDNSMVKFRLQQPSKFEPLKPKK